MPLEVFTGFSTHYLGRAWQTNLYPQQFPMYNELMAPKKTSNGRRR